jgi:hypothetical protein
LDVYDTAGRLRFGPPEFRQNRGSRGGRSQICAGGSGGRTDSPIYRVVGRFVSGPGSSAKCRLLTELAPIARDL